MTFSKLQFLIVITLFFTFALKAQKDSLPFEVDSLYNFSDPETLGLQFANDIETFSIFSPNANDNKYNHGVVLFPFKGMLYAQWQSSARDEDSEDTQVFYSRSADGENWEKPTPMTEKWNKGIKTSGGWWSDGETLVAYICVWPENENKPKEGYTQYITSTDGKDWESPQKVLNNQGKPVKGIIEQDIHQLPGGPIITAFHMQPGLIVKPYFTDDPRGISGWTSGNFENMPSSNKYMSRGIEPSWFYRDDGAIVMIFRDQESSFNKLASVSLDKGRNWTTPVMVKNSPDSRAKQSAGNLPDGTAYMVNNPTGNKNRFPLVITLSKDGFKFDKAYLVRSGGRDMQPMKFDGKYKRPGYSYPKSVIWGDYLYISYATNKEDVELSRIPIQSLIY